MRIVRAGAVLFFVLGALGVMLPGSAGALGAPIQLATNFDSRPSGLTVDANGDAYAVWAPASADPEVIDYCMAPAGASSCSQTGTLMPPGSGSSSTVDDAKVIVDGSTVVVMDVVGGESGDYEVVQEWTAPAGTTNFTPVDNGEAVADPPDLDSYLRPIVVPGANAVGTGEPDDGMTFMAWQGSSSLSDPPTCSVTACGDSPQYAVLSPSQDDWYSTNFASQTGSDPGVMVVASGSATACPSGSPGATSFAYGSGSNPLAYNISPGQSGSAWSSGMQNLDCVGNIPVVAGGPSGFGIFEIDQQTNTMIYTPFDQAKDSFDNPYYTVFNGTGLSTSLNQDGTGGLYAVWIQNQAPVVSYSNDGGKLWAGPTTLNSQTVTDLVSAMGSDGQGWIEWDSGPDLYMQPFTQSDIGADTTTLATSQTSGTSTGAMVSLPDGTTGETDTATLSGTNASAATGTVTFSLMTSCSGGTEVTGYSPSSEALSGPSVTSAPVSSALAPGTYDWVVSYGGDRYNAASSSTCGAETLTIEPAPVPTVPPPPKDTVNPTGIIDPGTLQLTVGCSTIPCSGSAQVSTTTPLLAAIDAPPLREGALAFQMTRTRTRTITLATGKFTLTKTGMHAVTLKLTATGRSYVKKHSRIVATVKIVLKADGLTKTTSTSVKFAKKARV